MLEIVSVGMFLGLTIGLLGRLSRIADALDRAYPKPAAAEVQK